MLSMKLLETLMIFALISLFSVAGFMSYGHYAEEQELKQATAQLTDTIEFSERLSQIEGKTVYLCASETQETCSQSWQGDFFIFTSDDPAQIQTILKKIPALPHGVDLDIDGFKDPPLYFMNNGETANNANFKLSNSSGVARFTLSATGIVSSPISSPLPSNDPA